MKLLIASPCQMVITDKEGAVGHSLIGIFHNLKIRVPESAEVPPDALLPKEWVIFSKWELDPDESTKEVKLSIEAFWPNGEPFFRNELVATEIAENQTAFIVRALGFPMGQNGKIRIVLSVFADGALAHEPVELGMMVDLEKNLPL